MNRFARKETQISMVTNFRIKRDYQDHELHLRLSGDFNGRSAKELLEVISANGNSYPRVIIHTGGLDHIHPFGRSVFHSFLGSLRNRPLRLRYTGKNAAQFAS
jgi:anti-anti-sigma regulatory factor